MEDLIFEQIGMPVQIEAPIQTATVIEGYPAEFILS